MSGGTAHGGTAHGETVRGETVGGGTLGGGTVGGGTVGGGTVRAALFDLDGTLADSEPLIAQAIQGMFSDIGHTVSLSAVQEALGPPLEGMVTALLGRPLQPGEYDRMRSAYLARYNRTLDQVRPLPGAEALLDGLRDAGVAVAVVTNKRESGAHEQLAAMGWGDRFGVVIGADTAGGPKPDPAPAHEALRRLALPATGSAFIGDTDTDMACARAAGIDVRIGIARVRSPQRLRDAGATHLCRHLDEVRQILLGV